MENISEQLIKKRKLRVNSQIHLIKNGVGVLLLNKRKPKNCVNILILKCNQMTEWGNKYKSCSNHIMRWYKLVSLG